MVQNWIWKQTFLEWFDNGPLYYVRYLRRKLIIVLEKNCWSLVGQRHITCHFRIVWAANGRRVDAP